MIQKTQEMFTDSQKNYFRSKRSIQEKWRVFIISKLFLESVQNSVFENSDQTGLVTFGGEWVTGYGIHTCGRPKLG